MNFAVEFCEFFENLGYIHSELIYFFNRNNDCGPDISVGTESSHSHKFCSYSFIQRITATDGIISYRILGMSQ